MFLLRFDRRVPRPTQPAVLYAAALDVAEWDGDDTPDLYQPAVER